MPTHEGWLKGINSTLLTPENDMGRDAAYAISGNPNALIGRDVFGLSLGYDGDGDFEAINATRWDNTAGQRPFAPLGAPGLGSTLATENKALYNGNIAHTTNSLAPFTGYPDSPAAPGQVLAMAYQYDQLNRLKQARGVEGLTTTNQWADVDDDAATDRYRSMYWYDANGNIDTIARYNAGGVLYDAMGYGYHLSDIDPGPGIDDRKVRNRLYHVRDEAPDAAVTDIGDYPLLTTLLQDRYNTGAPGQRINDLNNYGYDALGNLVRDTKEEIEAIEWTVAGKVRAVSRPSTSPRQALRFTYGVGGQRIVKEVQSSTGTALSREHYIRDAQGNVMATYKYDIGEASLMVTERGIYGSSRLGVDAYALELGGNPPYDPLLDPSGLIRYELTDHLGNVSAVISDELAGVDETNDQIFEYFQPELLAAQGYEPGGSLLPGRNYSSGSYRYGFNGQEKDDEVNGSSGTSYTAEFWQYDPRVARRWNLDPKPQIYISDYAAFGLNPILNVDPNGAYFFGMFGSTSEQRKSADSFALQNSGTVVNRHSKHICVSYHQQATFGETPVVYNRHQYFYNDGGLISQEPTLRATETNWMDEWSDSDATIDQLTYGIADGMNVFAQANPIGRMIKGSDPVTHLNGRVANNNETAESWTSAPVPVGGSMIVSAYRSISRAARVSRAFESVRAWLGKGAKHRLSPKGNDHFYTGDKQIRFDVKDSHGDAPHIHLEDIIEGKPVDATPTHRLYPKSD